MSKNEQNPTPGGGSWGGLKKLFFTEEHLAKQATENPENAPVVTQSAPVQQPFPSNPSTNPTTITSTSVVADPSLEDKLFSLLEKINEPGMDFFEVWNAAIEMGGANSINIKAAITSLKFADATLSVEKVVSTGANYVKKLTDMYNTEEQRKLQEKQKLEQGKSHEAKTLQTEIDNLDTQIKALQKQQQDKQSELNQINSKFDPQINQAETRITQGRIALTNLIKKMEDVILIVKSN